MEFQEIKSICDAQDIATNVIERRSGRQALEIKIPKERTFTSLYATDGRTAEVFSEIPEFYKYRFVKGYEAIWSPEEDILECEVFTPFMGMLLRRLYRKLVVETEVQEEDREELITIPSPINGAEIELGASTTYFQYFSYLKEELPRVPIRHMRGRNAVTLKVKNAGLKHHADALNMVVKIFASICFQINVSTNISIQLAPERFPRERDFRRDDEKVTLTQARYEYDIEPLSMYWHAENMMGMPLQEYFSYYQAVEYYFTVYSFEEAQRKVRNLIKNPLFNIDNDKDLSKVLNVVKYSNSSNSFGNELSQLKSTIKACVNIDELREWFSEDGERSAFFESKPAKKISKTTIKSSFLDDDLIDAIAKRVYEIRCRIVHTKGTDDNVEVLHPFSNEATQLKHDLAMIAMLCTKVIISNGRPLGAVNA
jgi:hypothetical protein